VHVRTSAWREGNIKVHGYVSTESRKIEKNVFNFVGHNYMFIIITLHMLSQRCGCTRHLAATLFNNNGFPYVPGRQIFLRPRKDQTNKLDPTSTTIKHLTCDSTTTLRTICVS
jgi:hypothetical protein